ncbi:T9SS type A sorting domain-containing protein [Parabacteroides sp. FAFU027]|uniref:T9SS type A sorting domain-containing protein n=1 Tax=Parabacteroides sp. FAFU027 TaxID=2922715 RepID=UPI001FAF733D|nr:T9SS type A sorting domain-containing protein [Parabacteroides sp. FAFU027]
MKATFELFLVRGLLRLISAIGKCASKSFSSKSASMLIFLVGTMAVQTAVAEELVKSVRLQVAAGSYTDELYVGFFSSASDGYDAYDSEKMDNGPTYPAIWTYADGVRLVINGLSPYTGNKQITVGFQAGQTGSFSIKATEILNFAQGTTVLLTDNKTGISQDLALNPVYYFMSNAETSNRFTLTISTKTATDTSTTTTTITTPSIPVDTTTSNTPIGPSENSSVPTNIDSVNIASNIPFTAVPSNGGSILVTLKDLTLKGASISLYTMYGKHITKTAAKDVETIVGSNLKEGIYIVEVKSKNNRWSQKVSIK